MESQSQSLQPRVTDCAMPIELLLHEHDSRHYAVLRADFRRRELVQIVACVFVVVIWAIVLTGCGRITPSHMISQTANSKKFTEPKSRTPSPPPSTTRSRMISQAVSTKKFTESKSRTPIPLPAAPLLSPQPEPSCEFETTGSNAGERQKLDYERQCYRHAEMIVRSRLQLLQGSVEETISLVNRSEQSGL